MMQPLSEYGDTTASPTVQAIQALLDAAHKPGYPGAAVIAARDSEAVFRGAYGLANVELDVSLAPHMVFRLASITKQFTAMAIMILAEQGKLSLDDDLATLLPDYPATTQRITVEHLLTHTSGIPNYTAMPEWYALMRNDLALYDLIALWKDQPLRFNPGERWAYCNSAYVLLGAIIERVSGQSYDDFLLQHIFEPLGMHNTSGAQNETIIPGRVAGYERGANGLQNASYLSMTHPYAAGALMSTVDDLLLWDEALYSDQLVSKAMLERAHRPFVLNDGTPTAYGYGWAIFDYDGDHIVAHAGGINGFQTYALRIPAEHVYVAVLMNSTLGEPPVSMLAFKISRILLGRPYEEPVTIPLDVPALEQYVGVYAGRHDEEHVIRREEDHLVLALHDGERHVLKPYAPDLFFVPDGFGRIRFERDGQVLTGWEFQELAKAERATRTDRPLPAERVEVTLDPSLLERYRGEYVLAPNTYATIAGDEKQLTIQMPGQEAIPLFASSETVFFIKVIDIEIVFEKDERGDIVALEINQGGQCHRALRRV
jgi:CubicO group peptidase (beta-lactamase class C family)